MLFNLLLDKSTSWRGDDSKSKQQVRRVKSNNKLDDIKIKASLNNKNQRKIFIINEMKSEMETFDEKVIHTIEEVLGENLPYNFCTILYTNSQ